MVFEKCTAKLQTGEITLNIVVKTLLMFQDISTVNKEFEKLLYQNLYLIIVQIFKLHICSLFLSNNFSVITNHLGYQGHYLPVNGPHDNY